MKKTDKKVYKLEVGMIKKVSSLFVKFKPEMVDLSPFEMFEKDVLQVGNVLDTHQIEFFANESKKLLTQCKNYSAVVYVFYKEARRRLTKVESIFILGKAEKEWMKKQKVYFDQNENYKYKNITDSIRTALLSVNPEVEEACILKLKWEALDKWFSDTFRDLENSHNWYKKLFDKINRNLD